MVPPVFGPFYAFERRFCLLDQAHNEAARAMWSVTVSVIECESSPASCDECSCLAIKGNNNNNNNKERERENNNNNTFVYNV